VQGSEKEKELELEEGQKGPVQMEELEEGQKGPVQMEKLEEENVSPLQELSQLKSSKVSYTQ